MEEKKPEVKKIVVKKKPKPDNNLKFHEIEARLDKIEREQRSFDNVLKKAMDLAERVAKRMGLE
tara:strand:+ start:1318 stop:1509 length:192 start_codon:yes stop_codon:yes gene_type:complete